MHPRARFLRFAAGAAVLAGAVLPAEAQSANPVTTAVVASTATAIPGGAGNFTNFYPDSRIAQAPAISNGNVVFWGAGGGGQQGIYVAFPSGVVGWVAPFKVADLMTAIRGGAGDFTSFYPNGPIRLQPQISGPYVAFAGFGANGQTGIYVAYPSTPIGGVAPFKVADQSAAIPNGPIGGSLGNFTGFSGLALSGPDAAFLGFGAGWQGIYAAIPNGPIGQVAPFKVADLATPISGGAGAFTSFAAIPSNPRVNGQSVAFIGLGASGQQGIYVALPPGPIGQVAPFKVADTATLIPGDAMGRTFTGFSDIALPPSPIGNRTRTLAFVGAATGSSVPGLPPTLLQQGVYTVMLPPSPVGGVPPTPTGGKVADLTTPVPGGGVFVQFGSVAVSGSGAVVFDAWYTSGGVLLHGLFTNIGGTLMKVLDNTQSLGGKPLSDFAFGSGGFGGARMVFTAQFQDGSQGIGAARVNNLQCSEDDGEEPCER